MGKHLIIHERNVSWGSQVGEDHCMQDTVLRSSELIVLICWVFYVGNWVFLCLSFWLTFLGIEIIFVSSLCLSSIVKIKSTHKLHILCSPFPESEHQKLWMPDPFTTVAAFAGTLVSELLWEQWPRNGSRAVVRLLFWLCKWSFKK